LFRVETNNEGKFSYSDNDRALAGQILIIEIEHPAFEPHIEHRSLTVRETLFGIGLQSLVPIPQLKGYGLDEATRKLSGVRLSIGSLTRYPLPIRVLTLWSQPRPLPDSLLPEARWLTFS
jgi:hypothetical protein